MRNERLRIEDAVWTHHKKSADFLTIAVVGQAHYCNIFDIEVSPQRVLDFLGKDFLARSVDARRTTSEQRDRAVVVDGGVVAEDRGALPIDDREGFGGLLGILVVTDWPTPEVCDETDVARSGNDVAAIFA